MRAPDAAHVYSAYAMPSAGHSPHEETGEDVTRLQYFNISLLDFLYGARASLFRATIL